MNTTGVKRGNEEMGSPKSGASMIHSAVSPLALAPGGAASTIGTYWLVVTLPNSMCPTPLLMVM